MAFFVNPWNIYISGRLELTVQGDHFSARLNNISSHVPFTIAEDEAWDCYKYSPLVEDRDIRLLELFPGENGTPLRGRMYHTSLEASEIYIAISYTWGPALKPYRLQTGHGDLPISASLYSALVRLQNRNEPVTIWVDGISINQRDEPEKVRQIGLLPDIFREAESVFGWVGEQSEDSHLAIEKLRSIKRPSKQKSISTFSAEVWGALSRLFSRSWFERSWIVQEVILARDLVIVCGNDKLRWDDLYQAALSCREHANRSVTALDIPATGNLNAILSPGETRHGYQCTQMRHKLMDLFEFFHHCKSTRRRDRLFTLLGVAADTDSPSFRPDYSSQLEAIVRRYALVYVERKQTSQLLYRGRISSQPDRFPSWIPDWTASPYPKTITPWHAEREFCASATKSELARISPTNDSVLLNHGCIVDRIVKVGICTSKVDVALDYIADVLKLIDSLQSYPTGESIDDLRWKIPIANAKESPWGDWADINFLASFRALTEYLGIH